MNFSSDPIDCSRTTEVYHLVWCSAFDDFWQDDIESVLFELKARGFVGERNQLRPNEIDITVCPTTAEFNEIIDECGYIIGDTAFQLPYIETRERSRC